MPYAKDILEQNDPVTLFERTNGPRADYFNALKGMTDGASSGLGFLGWVVAQEPAWETWHKGHSANPVNIPPSAAYVNDVYAQIRGLDAGAGGSHALYLENPTVAITADMLRQYNTGCDILAYNVVMYPTPEFYDDDYYWPDPWRYLFTRNKWESVTGDTATSNSNRWMEVNR